MINNTALPISYDIKKQKLNEIKLTVVTQDNSMEGVSFSSGEEKLGIFLSCILTKDQNLSSLLNVSFTADNSGYLFIHYYDGDDIEMTMPDSIPFFVGENLITTKYAFINKAKGYHRISFSLQQNTAEITNCNARLDVFGEEIFKANFGPYDQEITDISFYQPDFDVYPKEIWYGLKNFPNANNISVVSEPLARDFSISHKPSSSVAEYTFENLKDLALEFDGSWKYVEEEKRYAFVTEGTPYIFLLGTDGLLKVKHEDSEIILDNGVSQMSVVRGYKSNIDKTQDQGLIVAYIKNNIVYYRAYAYFLTSDNYVWDMAFEIPDCPANIESVRVFRLNDYRVAFVTSNGIENHWFITERTYISMAVRPEKILGKAISNYYIAVIKTEDIDKFVGTEIFPEDDEAPIDVFQIQFQYPLVSLIDTIDTSKFSVINTGTNVPLKSVTIDGSVLNITPTIPQTAQQFGNSTITISWTDDDLKLAYSNDFTLKIDAKEYSYTIIRPIGNLLQDADEMLAQTAKGVYDVTITQLQYYASTINESIVPAPLASYTASIIPLDKLDTVIAEINLMTATATFSTTITLVGEQPI